MLWVITRTRRLSWLLTDAAFCDGLCCLVWFRVIFDCKNVSHWLKASWREREQGKKLADETRLEEERVRTWRSQSCQHQIPSNFSNFINHFSRYGTETQEESILFTNLHESPSVSSDLLEEYTDEGTSVLADGANICPVKGKNERFPKNPIWLYGYSPSW